MEEKPEAFYQVKILVDTNIVFSCILNSTGGIGKILLTSKNYLQFYSVEFLKTELLKHRSKLLKRTRLEPQELDELQSYVTANITFINEQLIPQHAFQSAENLLKNIDPDDTPFVALATHLKTKLWTGDKALYDRLKAKGFNNIISTSELLLLLDKLERKSKRREKK